MNSTVCGREHHSHERYSAIPTSMCMDLIRIEFNLISLLHHPLRFTKQVKKGDAKRGTFLLVYNENDITYVVKACSESIQAQLCI